MPALEAGVQAPEIELQYLDGRKFSLKEERKKGPVVAVFFKVSCPVCQMALPYLDRIYKAYAESKAFTFVTNVPTTFLISSEGEIDFATVSWSKADVEQLNRRLAAGSGVASAQIFQPGENVSEFKPG